MSTDKATRCDWSELWPWECAHCGPTVAPNGAVVVATVETITSTAAAYRRPTFVPNPVLPIRYEASTTEVESLLVRGECAGITCGKPADDGFICRACLRILRDVLAEVPWLLRELDIAEKREARFADKADKIKRAGGSAPMPLDISAADARRYLHERLTRWAARFSHSVSIGKLAQRNPALASAWLMSHLEGIRTFHEAGDLLEDICAGRATAKYAIDRPRERRYLGECGFTWTTDDGVEIRCTETLWGFEGEPEAICKTCGAEWIAEKRMADITNQAMSNMPDRIMTATQAAETLIAYGVADDPTPAHLADRIDKWVSRSMLVKRIDLPTAAGRLRPGYRLGDGIDLVKAAAERKAELAEKRNTKRRSA